MSQNLERLMQLLAEIFQFDQAELDFGIYRIMNAKREEVTRFLYHDLLPQVREVLAQYEGESRAAMAGELEKAREQAKGLGFDDPGQAPRVRELQARYNAAFDVEAAENEVYSHLYNFFRRYYREGDFISQRRYKEGVYAIPYEGEEVKLYWANHDQYYIKTSEYLRNYTFKLPSGKRVHFKLVEADTEKDNNRAPTGNERRFILSPEQPLAEENGELVIRFQYQPHPDNAKQADLNAAAVDLILNQTTGFNDWRLELGTLKQTKKNPNRTLLEKHLTDFTARNTFDYFIHKDLGGFLRRELDFYIKNEVMHLDDIENETSPRVEQYLAKIKAIRRIAHKLIDFLAQLENFQKKLWLKKKFVVETQYCITVGHIPEAFYPEIAECTAQWDEWKSLGFLAGSADAGSADVSSAITGEGADVSSAGNTDVPSAGNADVSSAGNADVPSAQHKGWHARGALPHFDAAYTYQFITFRLHDSVPASVIEQWKQELHWREGLAADSEEAVELRKRIEQYADSGKGACYLRDERIARLVQDALTQFDGERYHLIAWCVMPNHVHVLIRQVPGHSLSKVIQSWKSFTAHEANKLLGRSGDFWLPDYFDRYIRDEKHFRATVEYILQNPVKAGLVDSPEQWPWSGYTESAAPGNAPGSADVSSAITGNADISSATTGNADVSSATTGNADVSSATTGNADVSSATPSANDLGGRDVRAPRSAGGRDVRAPRIAFLKAHPTLPLDTRHFPQDFTDRLLASFEDLDEITDGLLIHSENFQALNLLQERYRERVKCIYIDPPYNTGSDEFIYRDNYQHSCWLSMLINRLEMARSLMGNDAAIFTSIDDHEQAHLRKLYESIFGSENFVANVIWQKKYSPQNDARWLSDNHDFLLCFAKSKENWQPGLLPRTEEQNARYENLDNDPRGPWKPSGLDVKTYAAEYDYEIVTPSGRRVRPPKGACWRVSRERFQELVADNRIWFGQNGDNVPAIKRFLSEVKQGVTPLTLWTYKEVGHNQQGAQELKAMLREGEVFFTSPKPTSLLNRVITIGVDRQGIVLDYFAGSGTTGHAVINLNREDGGRRKFILVEMAEYFDTVLVPRLKKVTFTPEWKDGKPKRMPTPEEIARSPRMFKILRLESYEDTLNNLELRRTEMQQSLLDQHPAFREDYVLRYMLDVESRGSASLLNLDRFEDPFNYKLNIATGSVGETKPTVVDLVETFNYLIGLRVKTIDHIGGVRVVTGTNPQGERVLILWRNTKEMDNDALDAWFRKQGYNTKDQEYDVIYVNGDNNLENLRKPDQTWKVRLTEEEFRRLMFDVQDV